MVGICQAQRDKFIVIVSCNDTVFQLSTDGVSARRIMDECEVYDKMLLKTKAFPQ